MNVLVAGATGALGRHLVPQLVARGHEVVGMTRSASRQDAVRRLGATPVVADALDPDAVARAVAGQEVAAGDRGRTGRATAPAGAARDRAAAGG
jgi:2-alkyl-3-oxoalkanoate reductase